MRSDVAYILSRDAYQDAQIALLEAARARKAASRRAETEALIAAVHAERLARTKQIARDLGYGGER